MLQLIIFWREDQLDIWDLMAVPLKKPNMWNPTIPQDKKFSTLVMIGLDDQDMEFRRLNRQQRFTSSRLHKVSEIS